MQKAQEIRVHAIVDGVELSVGESEALALIVQALEVLGYPPSFNQILQGSWGSQSYSALTSIFQSLREKGCISNKYKKRSTKVLKPVRLDFVLSHSTQEPVRNSALKD